MSLLKGSRKSDLPDAAKSTEFLSTIGAAPRRPMCFKGVESQMNQNVRVLFGELAGLETIQREDVYARQAVPAAIRDELESLLSFDSQHGSAITSAVRGAAEKFLISNAPVSEDGRCGPYRLIRLLGNGGMGAVYLAERADGELDQKVAIKFIRAGYDLPSLRARFLRERQILASLNHPGIARVLDVGHNAGHPYLVMEYVEGVSIDRYAGTLDLRGVLGLFIKVAEAVSYAHRNLIVHRDLKPSNILIDSAGNPKLLDFGIAKLIDAPSETQTVERVMTPEYASPEQLRGEPQATTTDIFSLGAVLYRLLTGRGPRQFASIRNELPSDLTAILGKAMREEPAERYRSVDQFCADLEAYLDHRPVQAKRGNALYHTRKFLRRRWIPMTAGALALFGLTAGMLVANRERAVAERRFDEVRQLSKQFLDLDSDIRALPGSTKARSRIVSASLEYLERLAAETRQARWDTHQNVELRLDVSGAYLKVARVQGIPINSNLGQFTAAKQSLAKANALVEPLLQVRDGAQRRRALLISAEIARDSMILADTEKRSQDALTLSRKAANRLDTLLAEPGVTSEQAAIAAGLYVHMAQLNCNLHHLDEATLYAKKAVEITRTIGGDERQLGRALGILSNAARFAGDLHGALEAIHASREIAEKLARPEDVESMFQLAAALWREGRVLGELNTVNLDRPREAEPLFQRAMEIALNVANKDADDYTSRSYIAMAGRELGDVLRDSNPRRALMVYDEARRRVAEVNNPKSRRDEALMLIGSSYALRHLGRNMEARQRLDAALEILKSLKACPAPRIEPDGECEKALRALADFYAGTGEAKAAIKTYQDLLKNIEASLPEPKTDLRHANSLSHLYARLASAQMQAGQVAAAKALNQRRAELWMYWDQKLPANSFVGRNLAAARME